MAVTCKHFLCLWQETGLDTVDANRALGLPDDCREYTSVTNILADLGIKSIMLMVRRRCRPHVCKSHLRNVNACVSWLPNVLPALTCAILPFLFAFTCVIPPFVLHVHASCKDRPHKG